MQSKREGKRSDHRMVFFYFVVCFSKAAASPFLFFFFSLKEETLKEITEGN